jgi:hypothetical protein
MTLLTRLAFLWSTWLWYHSVTPNFKAKPNAHNMCAQESSFTHTIQKMDTELPMSQYIVFITKQCLYKRLSRTLSKALQWKGTITPQAIVGGKSLVYNSILKYSKVFLSF